MPKQMLFDDDARKKVLSGIRQLAAAVKVTMGPSAKQVLLGKAFGAPQAVNDGVTVAKEIELPDPFENMGAKLGQEAASKTNDVAGDGTTASVVLLEAIYREGMKHLGAGADPMALKKGIDKAVAAVVEQVRSTSTPVKGREQMESVATISANNDRVLGKLIAEAMEKVGKEGVITVEEGKSLETKVEFSEGLQFDKGYVSPYFVTKVDALTCELDDPYILFFEKKISAIRDIVPVLETVLQAGRPLLIICEELDGEALATLVVNKLRGTLQVCAVKAPAFGDRRKAIMEDMAIVCGGQLVSEDLGVKLEKVGVDYLGSARRVKVEREKTTIVEGAGDKKKIAERVAQLRKQVKDTTSDYDREKLEERLAKILGGVAVVKVGGATEAEMKERKYRVEDAVNAAKAAREEGFVPGGGVALFRAIGAVRALKLDGDEALGAKVIERALVAPIRQIATNTGADADVVVEEVGAKEGSWGFDAAKREYRDLVAAGIIDPTKVVRSALQNAANVAGTFLTSTSLITDLKEKDEKKKIEGTVR